MNKEEHTHTNELQNGNKYIPIYLAIITSNVNGQML